MTVQQAAIKMTQTNELESSKANKANKGNKDNKGNGANGPNEAGDGGEDLFSSLLLLALLGMNKTGTDNRVDFSPSKDTGENPEKGEDILSAISGEDIKQADLTGGGTDVKSDIPDPMSQERIVSPAAEGFKDITELFREIDSQDNSSNHIDTKDKHIPVEGSDLIAFSPDDSILIDTDNNTQPFHTYIEKASVVQQISREMVHTFQIGSNSARIRLEPPELGKIYIEISVTDDNVNTLMSVENQEVKEIIETSLSQLEDELKNHGLNIDQFTVEMNEKGSGDRFVSDSPGEDPGSGRRASKGPDNHVINHINTSNLVTVSRGLISIFA